MLVAGHLLRLGGASLITSNGAFCVDSVDAIMVILIQLGCVSARSVRLRALYDDVRDFVMVLERFQHLAGPDVFS